MQLSGTPSAEWHQATRALVAAQRGYVDCATIQLDVSDRGQARLTFITLDGRRAERDLLDPAELVATVDALSVTGPQPLAAEASQAGLRDPSGPPAAAQPTATPRPKSARVPAGLGAHFALQLGARGGADRLLSPVITGSASLELRRWELGVMATYELQYFDLATFEQTSSGVAATIFAGRRQPLGDISVRAAARLSLARMVPNHGDGPAADDGDQALLESRVGAHAGVTWPRESSVRLLADLAVDVVAGRDIELPVTPSWALSALAGAEIVLP